MALHMQLMIDNYEFIWDATDWIKRKKYALIEKVKVEPIFNLQFMYPLWTNEKRLFHSGGSDLNHFQTIYISQHLFKHQMLVKQNNPTRKFLILSVSSISRLLISRLDKDQIRRQTQRKPWGWVTVLPSRISVHTVHLCVHTGQRSTSSVISQEWSTLCYEAGFLIGTRGLLVRLVWLSSKPRGIAYLLPAQRYT